MTTPTSTTTLAPSRQTLDRLPGRVLKFLSAASRSRAVRAMLAAHGYTDAEHGLGWSLLHRASGFQQGASLGDDVDPAVRDAAAAIDNWDEPNFARALAALRRFDPAIADFVFDGGRLKPAQGAASLVAVETFLRRLDALEKGEERKGSRKRDLAALELLARRGITREERARLAHLLVVAQGGSALPPPPEDEALADAAQQQALFDLYAWFTDWSTVARTVITRRDYRIRLGLAERRSRSSDAGDGTNGPPPSGPA